MRHAIADIGTKWFRDGELAQTGESTNDLRIRIKDVALQYPEIIPHRLSTEERKPLYPWECRERHISYRGKLLATLEYTINDGDPVEFDVDLGKLPVMVKVGLSYIFLYSQAVMCCLNANAYSVLVKQVSS